MITKFRAWDKARNEMNYKVMVGNCDTDDENWTCPIIWIEEKKDWLHFDDYDSIMQSTGLKDKNGKEIFEGDVLKSNKYITSVFYERGAYCVKFCRTPNTTVTMDVISFIKKYKTRIVGNIYENPELLEVIDAKRK